MNNIGHFYSARDEAEVVLVVPEAVGAATLLVDEELAFTDLGDLCYPVDGEPGEGVEFVFDQLAGVDVDAGSGMLSIGRRECGMRAGSEGGMAGYGRLAEGRGAEEGRSAWVERIWNRM